MSDTLLTEPRPGKPMEDLKLSAGPAARPACSIRNCSARPFASR